MLGSLAMVRHAQHALRIEPIFDSGISDHVFHGCSLGIGPETAQTKVAVAPGAAMEAALPRVVLESLVPASR